MAETIKKKNEALEWRAAEFEYVHKDVSFYWIAGTIIVVLMLFSLWQKNFFFFIFLAIAGPTMFFFSKRKPKIFQFTVNDRGVGIEGHAFYEYKDLEGFALIRREGYLDILMIKRKVTVNPFVRILVDSEMGDKVRDALATKLKKINYELSLLDIVSEWFGF
ncbi:hypothetical protein A3A21_00515 [Candidatus Jorgensenbacteria bacterium RIFCSPLOWO2_01_FULL_45_25b]|uniref:DUF5673 domain-containing protein n=2 Tax=Parcubacteria group TaxID=1794811 RepID=A0A1F6BU68_9BACT|nr:MAG: hypothetical protein A2819_00730 [Candidatus Azambacteria bacterium RIFCSPHIGHO2_01_FULL_40_24]OGG40459.1 MAG: hypothetical protein A3A21_00515 [Candidatus Jorgensenbacteria bacterium RIFCSPLOWO2_01_FULL_45_25b]